MPRKFETLRKAKKFWITVPFVYSKLNNNELKISIALFLESSNVLYKNFT